MTPEAREARKRYHREWRRNNPDKVRRYQEARWEKLARKFAEEAGKNGDAS